MDAGADRTFAEGAGLNAQGTGSIKSALPAWMRNGALPAGSVPRQTRAIVWAPAYTCFPLTGASRADCSAPTTGASDAPTNRTDSRDESSPTWFPTTRKEYHHGQSAVPVGSAV